MQFGISLRNVGIGVDPRRPLAHKDEVLAIAQAADEAGLDAVWVADHVVLPTEPSAPHPYSGVYFDPHTPILDPIATLAVVAGRTRRVKLGFGVLVAPYRHPLITAKLVATIDVFSEGRVILGVGTGWLAEEFAVTGGDYAHRGRLTDEYIRYFREAWTKDNPDFHGELFQLSGFSFWPKPVQRPIPIWVGGKSRAAMRRAAALGDGWEAIGVPLPEIRDRIAELRRLCAEYGRDPESLTVGVRGVPFRLTARPDPNPDRQPFTGSPGQVVADIQRYEQVGIGHVLMGSGMPGWDAHQTLKAIEDFSREVLPRVRGGGPPRQA